VSVKRVLIEDASAEAAAEEKAELNDLRITHPVIYNKAGKRWASFQSALEKLSPEEVGDWPLEGERTIEWLCNFISQHGPTPDARHTKWTMEQHISVESIGCVLHDLLGFVIELAVCYDQLDVSNCASIEMVGRIYQLLEETGGSMLVEGLEHYVGRSKTGGRRRGVALAPSLAKHVTTNLGTEIEIMKQRRKAREEEAAAKESGKKHKGDKPK
jgi:hypothetical protein